MTLSVIEPTTFWLVAQYLSWKLIKIHAVCQRNLLVDLYYYSFFMSRFSDVFCVESVWHPAVSLGPTWEGLVVVRGRWRSLQPGSTTRYMTRNTYRHQMSVKAVTYPSPWITWHTAFTAVLSMGLPSEEPSMYAKCSELSLRKWAIKMCAASVSTGQCMWMEFKVIKLTDSVVMP
jgi:hypothetical protein